MWYRIPCIISYDIRDLVMPHYRLDVAGDISDVSDMHFDTNGTEIKKYSICSSADAIQFASKAFQKWMRMWQ
jgi:hypothetical protein